MNTLKLLGIVLLVAGTAALAYGGFNYTKETHEAKLGPFEFAVKEQSRVQVPTWAGVAGIVLGAGLLLAGGRGK